MNKTQKLITGALFSTIIGLIIYLLVKAKTQEKKITELEVDRLRLQKFLFQKYDTSKDVITIEIDRLIKQFDNGHYETVKNLIRAKELYTQGHGVEAIRKLVVVIENKIKLKLEVEKDSWFNTLSDKKKKFAGLKELIHRAKEINLFNDLQFSLAISATNIRNGESHHEGFEDEQKKIFICLLGSIDIINILAPTNRINSLKQLETVSLN